jgi:hypothetical protein
LDFPLAECFAKAWLVEKVENHGIHGKKTRTLNETMSKSTGPESIRRIAEPSPEDKVSFLRVFRGFLSRWLLLL